MAESLKLPLIDLSSSDCLSTARLIRQACLDSGFFYVVNHGVEDELMKQVFEYSKKFFSLPLQEKMKLARKGQRGYSPIYAETHDTSLKSKGDLKEIFVIGPIEGAMTNLNQWPSEGNSETLLSWRPTLELYYEKLISLDKILISLIAVALNLKKSFFEEAGALHEPMGFLRLLHYPGEVEKSGEESIGTSAHSDYGIITLLATDGVPGLQICREKDKQPQIWEDVSHVDGAFVVNIGHMMERWTNCLFRSTLHRVLATSEERYSVAFFFDPNDDCVIQCLESCCSDAFPPRFPPIRSGDYFEERLRATYASRK